MRNGTKASNDRTGWLSDDALCAKSIVPLRPKSLEVVL